MKKIDNIIIKAKFNNNEKLADLQEVYFKAEQKAIEINEQILITKRHISHLEVSLKYIPTESMEETIVILKKQLNKLRQEYKEQLAKVSQTKQDFIEEINKDKFLQKHMFELLEEKFF